MKKYLNNIGVKVSIITVIINFLLFALKLVVGLFSSSQAIVSDAFHSLSDVITTFAVIIGLLLASKEPDHEHPYGHERIESIVAIILSFILFLSGLTIGVVGFRSIFNSELSIKIPGIMALVVAVISIIVKEGMFHYTMNVAKKIKSTSMEADAWHHRSDAMSSIGSFLGVLGARMGFPILDPLCSILICILIIKTAIEIFVTSTNGLLDTSCDDEITKNIIDTIIKTYKKLKIKDIKTRQFGSKCYIDVEIELDGNITLKEANRIVLKIHDKVEENFSFVKHCNIHVIPFE